MYDDILKIPDEAGFKIHRVLNSCAVVEALWVWIPALRVCGIRIVGASLAGGVRLENSSGLGRR